MSAVEAVLDTAGSWKQAFQWSRFKLDALGLITLLGQHEVDQALGSLTHKSWCEYLPLLASNVVATDSMARPVPGYQLFNITDRIQVLDVSGWFSRWLEAQELHYLLTEIKISRRTESESTNSIWYEALFMIPYFMIIVFLLWLGVFAGNDNWLDMFITLLNAVSLASTVICRSANLRQLRQGLGAIVQKNYRDVTATDECKVWVVTPQGCPVRVTAPRRLVKCLPWTPNPTSPSWYTASRTTCWLAFVIHAITLGTTSFLYQSACIILMIVSTLCLLAKPSHNGTQKSNLLIGQELSFEVEHIEEEALREQLSTRDTITHMHVYASMGMTQEEEESMRLWGLMPHATNQGWWGKYREIKSRVPAPEQNNSCPASAPATPAKSELSASGSLAIEIPESPVQPQVANASASTSTEEEQ